MTWVGLLLLVVGAWLAFKLAGALLKIVMFVVALVGAYWLVAPHMGWPTVSDLFYVFGPDFGGQRIEELADPKVLAKEATDRVVEGVVGGVAERFDPSAPTTEAQAQPLPEDAVVPVQDEPAD